MRAIGVGIFIMIITSIQVINAQSYFNGKFRKAAFTTNNYAYTFYDFSGEANVKAKYFAQNAYSQYVNWKIGKQILLVTAGAFSDSWSADAKPVGLCVDNGKIVSRIPDQLMDGMVVVYNTGSITVVDLDVNFVSVLTDTGIISLSPRSSSFDRYKFLRWGQENNITLFQTQLVYSFVRTFNFNNLYYGKKKERRFLAICKKGTMIHHVVIDGPDALELNLSASYAKATLEYDGFEVHFIMNLDTGCKNILHVYNGSYLQNLDPSRSECKSEAQIEKATNLLVYYRD